MSFLVYKSSAGSGKTFTLVKEYLKLALGSNNPMVFNQILAITFTNKAASEMTDRILLTLEEMSGVSTPMKSGTRDLMSLLAVELEISEALLKKRARVTLKKIVHNYRDFSVGTIDSFVHRIIRSFSTEMGLNQQFEVELNTDSILKRAVDLMLDRVGVDKVLTRFIKQYIDAKFEEGQTWKIDEDLFGYAKGLLLTHEWYYLNKAKAISLEEYAKRYEQLSKEVKEYQKHIGSLATVAFMYAIDGVEASSYANRGVLVNYFKKITQKDFQPPYGAQIQKLMDNESSKWFATKASAADKATIEDKRPFLEQKINEIQQFRSENEKRYLFQKLMLNNMYRVALLSEIDKYVQQIKQENDLVLISDFTELVGEITRNEMVPFIFEKLGERYNHFLFDEFQDTSLMQWHNMLPLVEESLSKGGTSLVVGDAKQSIYRWRGGVVEQFENLPLVYNPYADSYVQDREISLTGNNKEVPSLNKNYRSMANIVRFNNLFFERASKAFGGMIEEFYKDVKQEIKDEESTGYVAFKFFNGKTKEESTQAIKEEIATLIPRLVKEGYALKDMAILTKTKKDTPALVEYLNVRNINVISSESLLVGNSPAVKLVESTLVYFNKPGEVFYMSNVLIKINELFPKPNFHKVINTPKELDELRFQTLLSEWGISLDRKEILSLPLYEMVSAIVEAYGLQNIQDNRLASWMDYIFNLSQKSGIGIFDLLDDWEGQKDKLSIQIPEDVDAVNVLTIHKSKGLDWPVVIMAQGNWAIKHNKHTMWVEVPESDPVPVMIVPVSDNQLKDSVFDKELALESQRLLVDSVNAMYVAFTRAADRLYVMTHKPQDSFFGQVFPILEEMVGHEKVNVTYDDSSGKTELETFTFGELNVVEREVSNTDSNLIKLKNHKNSLYRTKLKVKKNYLKWMDDSGERNYGNLVHKAFSFISTATDLEEAILALINQGDIDQEEEKQVRTEITNVLHHPDVKPFFKEGLVVKNEAEIILANGDLLRPDRVVFDRDEVIVIDFKTGMRKPQHDQQIISYKQQLMQMGHASVRAILIYTSSVEVLEV